MFIGSIIRSYFEDPHENHRCVTGASSQNIYLIIITVVKYQGYQTMDNQPSSIRSQESLGLTLASSNFP